MIVGTNGVGKTSLCKEMVGSLQEKGRRTLIVDPDGMEWANLKIISPEDCGLIRPGMAARIVGPEKDDFPLLQQFSGGTLVLDDCRYYVKSQIAHELRQILVRRRQKDIDIFGVAHSLNEVPPVFWTFASHLVLFKTTDNPKRGAHNIPKLRSLLEEYIPRINGHENHYYREIIPLR